MKVKSRLRDQCEYKVIAEGCTIGQAFTMIENWSTDNKAKMDWWGALKVIYENEFIIECTKGDNYVVNTFIISE